MSPVAGVSTTLGQELPKFLSSEDADDEAKCQAECNTRHLANHDDGL